MVRKKTKQNKTVYFVKINVNQNISVRQCYTILDNLWFRTYIVSLILIYIVNWKLAMAENVADTWEELEDSVSMF